MNASKVLQALCAAAPLWCLLTVSGNAAPAPDQGRDEDIELRLGQQVFDELKARGEIIESSSLYDQLRPIADAITRVAQPQYDHPFKFYLVHEPNRMRLPLQEGMCMWSIRSCIS